MSDVTIRFLPEKQKDLVPAKKLIIGEAFLKDEIYLGIVTAHTRNSPHEIGILSISKYVGPDLNLREEEWEVQEFNGNDVVERVKAELVIKRN